ncbi:hypothetical protein BJX63DRAFT_287792 [Aspergillus granulosus]|uniref:Uncharacterized protein n=1 Tax=Aspergillus granulosus TaxID=176169 RepID=A0ABR4H8Q8_9EURO
MQAREKPPSRLHEAEQPSRVAGIRAARNENQWPRGHHEIKWRRSLTTSDRYFYFILFLLLFGLHFSKFHRLAPSQLSLFNLSPSPGWSRAHSRIRADDGKLIWRASRFECCRWPARFPPLLVSSPLAGTAHFGLAERNIQPPEG